MGVTRAGSWLWLNVCAKGATGYQVFANGTLIARTTSGRATSRSKATKKGATIRCRSKATKRGGITFRVRSTKATKATKATKKGVTIRVRSFTLKGGVSSLSNPIVLR